MCGGEKISVTGATMKLVQATTETTQTTRISSKDVPSVPRVKTSLDDSDCEDNMLLEAEADDNWEVLPSEPFHEQLVVSTTSDGFRSDNGFQLVSDHNACFQLGRSGGDLDPAASVRVPNCVGIDYDNVLSDCDDSNNGVVAISSPVFADVYDSKSVGRSISCSKEA